MVALGFSKDTKVSVLLKSVGAERVKDLYAARGASLYALVKLSGGDSESIVESVGNQQTMGAEGLVAPGGAPTEGAAPTSGGNDNENTDDDSEEIDGDSKQSNVKWVPGRNPYTVRIGEINCEVYLSSENGKININGINDKNRELLINFLVKKGIETPDADIIADSILDWMDNDDLTHINGAEDGYYGSLPDSYKSKDAQFSSIEELTLVRGVTPGIFEKIKDDITVYGDGKININVNIASKEILSSIPGLTDNMVDELSLYMEENGSIKTPEELRQIFWDLGVIGDSFEDVKPYLTLEQSDFITISAFAGGSKRVTNLSSEKPNLSGEQNRYSGYDYKLIAGKKDGGYKIFAVYPE